MLRRWKRQQQDEAYFAQRFHYEAEHAKEHAAAFTAARAALKLRRSAARPGTEASARTANAAREDLAAQRVRHAALTKTSEDLSLQACALLAAVNAMSEEDDAFEMGEEDSSIGMMLTALADVRTHASPTSALADVVAVLTRPVFEPMLCVTQVAAGADEAIAAAAIGAPAVTMDEVALQARELLAAVSAMSEEEEEMEMGRADSSIGLMLTVLGGPISAAAASTSESDDDYEMAPVFDGRLTSATVGSSPSPVSTGRERVTFYDEERDTFQEDTHREPVGSDVEPVAVAKVELTFNGDVSDFDEEAKARLLRNLAAFGELPVDQLRVVGVRRGSIIVEVEVLSKPAATGVGGNGLGQAFDAATFVRKLESASLELLREALGKELQATPSMKPLKAAPSIEALESEAAAAEVAAAEAEAEAAVAAAAEAEAEVAVAEAAEAEADVEAAAEVEAAVKATPVPAFMRGLSLKSTSWGVAYAQEEVPPAIPAGDVVRVVVDSDSKPPPPSQAPSVHVAAAPPRTAAVVEPPQGPVPGSPGFDLRNPASLEQRTALRKQRAHEVRQMLRTELQQRRKAAAKAPNPWWWPSTLSPSSADAAAPRAPAMSATAGRAAPSAAMGRLDEAPAMGVFGFFGGLFGIGGGGASVGLAPSMAPSMAPSAAASVALSAAAAVAPSAAAPVETSELRVRHDVQRAAAHFRPEEPSAVRQLMALWKSEHPDGIELPKRLQKGLVTFAPGGRAVAGREHREASFARVSKFRSDGGSRVDFKAGARDEDYFHMHHLIDHHDEAPGAAHGAATANAGVVAESVEAQPELRRVASRKVLRPHTRDLIKRLEHNAEHDSADGERDGEGYWHPHDAETLHYGGEADGEHFERLAHERQRREATLARLAKARREQLRVLANTIVATATTADGMVARGTPMLRGGPLRSFRRGDGLQTRRGFKDAPPPAARRTAVASNAVGAKACHPAKPAGRRATFKASGASSTGVWLGPAAASPVPAAPPAEAVPKRAASRAKLERSRTRSLERSAMRHGSEDGHHMTNGKHAPSHEVGANGKSAAGAELPWWQAMWPFQGGDVKAEEAPTGPRAKVAPAPAEAAPALTKAAPPPAAAPPPPPARVQPQAEPLPACLPRKSNRPRKPPAPPPRPPSMKSLGPGAAAKADWRASSADLAC